MIARLREWFGARTPREQWLLTVMAAVFLPVLAWLLVIRPVGNAYDEALERHLLAIERHGRVASLVEAARAQPGRSAIPRNVELQLVVSEAAGMAGVTLAEATPAGQDRVAVSVANSSAAAAGEWVRSLEGRGLAVEEFRMTPTAEGGVNVSARFARR